ncbi:MAG TPA: hypothetical protein VEK84_12030 [Terriglobales bacterium]|nr:hypothetical protein [Terriglobales bacterium]
MDALLDVEAAIVELRKPPRPLPSLTLREVRCGYVAGRSLAFSVILHQLALLAILLWGRFVFVHTPSLMINPPLEITRSDSVLYLPTLGGGGEGGGRAGGGSSDATEVSSGLRARSRRGFAYPGPQPMVSSPPRATLGIQTILQPALTNPPLLKQYLPLPNIVRPAAAPSPAPAQEALVVKAETLALRPTPDQPIAEPKITLPVAAASAIQNLATSKPAIPERPAVPRPPEVSDVPVGPRDQEGLLVLNAIPPPPEMSVRIPRAEARSLFAVAPADVTVIADPASGAKGGEASSSASGSGTRADIAKGDALAEIATGGDGTNHASGGSGSGSGGRYGSGHGSGLNPSGNSGGTGRGTGSEAGVGIGSGTSSGSGAGAGSAPGTGGFPGITIQGGRYGNGAAGGLHASLAPRRQTSYNMNIVSTASSGGGLPDIGVFQNEKVYTVYLDMKASDEDPAPSWILQYALLQPGSNPEGAPSTARLQGTPTPPYALLKDIPEFAPDLLRKYAHKLIVAFAVMNDAGQLEQITLRQNPDEQLASPLVEALSHWMFQPAQIDGKPVSLKILLGIRLAPGR